MNVRAYVFVHFMCMQETFRFMHCLTQRLTLKMKCDAWLAL